jgi:hypothetical protein
MGQIVITIKWQSIMGRILCQSALGVDFITLDTWGGRLLASHSGITDTNISEMSNNLLNQRTEFLFRALIQRYINDGNPVGSRVLARESGLEVSPATVRNIMADLEDMGLISSPHTSAGRMPTQKGIPVLY